MTHPWERQPGETSKAWHAFVAYRDAGPDRSIRAVTGNAPGRLRHLERWSSDHKWVARAAAWDAEQDRVAREAKLDKVRQVTERTAQEARLVQASSLVFHRELAARIARGDRDATEELRKMPVRDVARLATYATRAWKVGVQTEWAALGIDPSMPADVLEAASRVEDTEDVGDLVDYIMTLVPGLDEDQHAALIKKSTEQARKESETR